MRQPMIITGRKVLIGMLLFFGLIFTVNGTFFYFAIDSWPGLVTDKPYESGLVYNQILDDAEKQSQLGWESRIDITKAADGYTVTATLHDKNDQPLSGLAVDVVLRRPVNDVENIQASLLNYAPGIYTATLNLPAQGRWYVDLYVSRDGNTYRSEQEFMVGE
jgi:nitrogen fixation protein FixH